MTPKTISEVTAKSPNDAASRPPENPEDDCPVCHGGGWVRHDVPLGHADFGKLFPCQCRVKKMEVERQGVLIRYSGLSDMTRFTFQTLNADGRDNNPAQRQLRAAVATCRSYAEQPKGWLVLTGGGSIERTHLAAAVAHAVIERGQLAFFVTAADLLDRLRSTFSPNSEIAYDDLSERVRNTPLLILDDMTVQAATPWAQEKLFQLLNHRYNVLLPTVITISTPLNQLDERLKSRVTDAAVTRVVDVGGKTGSLVLCIPQSMEETVAQKTFASFEIDRAGVDAQGRTSLQTALRACKEFAEGPKDWLFIAGPPECGKTHLLGAIFNQRSLAGLPVVYARIPDLMEELRGSFRPGGYDSYQDVFERVKEAPVLLLDNLGDGHTTDWAMERLSQIIVHRYDAHLPTVIATQLQMDALERDLPPALSSRLLNPQAVGILPIAVAKYRSPKRPQIGDAPRRPRT